MIDGVGRMQPVAMAAGEVNAKPAEPVVVRREGGDRALVSSAGIGAALAAEPPVDAGKVASLRLVIEAGTYRADPEAIADAMLWQAGA